MRLKVLRNIGVKDEDPVTHQPSGLPPYGEGEVVDVDDKEGETLLKRGLAEHTDEPVAPKKKATPTPAPVFSGTVPAEHPKAPAKDK